MSRDLRLTAFCSAQGPEIFHSVTHHHEIWKEDPYDVEIIHRQARECLKRLLDRAITPPSPDSGRILLLLGKSGAGKTHLMRAFRNQVHARCAGYFSYMQMTTSVDNYTRYILSNTLDSLEKPYHEPAVATSGLMRLSNALVENDRTVPPRALRILREEKLTPELLNNLIYKLADRIVSLDDFSGIDLDLIRVLLYLQRDAPVGLKARVLQYLRCENLTDYDRRFLGGLTPRLHGDDPQRLLASLGRLIWAVDRGALVVCLDQLEDMYDGLESSAQRFRQAMKTVISLADQVPTLIVAISCLEDYYVQLRQSLTLSLLDRIEHDPEPVRLAVKRTPDEVEQLIAARLMVLYDDLDAPFDFSQPLYPFSPSVVHKGVEMPRVRDILDWCRRQRDHSIQTGEPPDDDALSATPDDEIQHWIPESGPASTHVIISLEQAWNDFRMQISSLPEGDAGLCALLAWAIRSCSTEMVSGHHFVAQEESDAVAVDIFTRDNRLVERLLVCLCNQSSLGGSLARQIQAAEERAGERIPVLVRCSPFPGSPKTKVAQQLGQLLARGGRRVVIEDSDWRAMWAMQSFRQFHTTHPGFQDWLKVERPLSRLPSLRALLELDRLASASSRHEPATAAATQRSPSPPEREPESADTFCLGRELGSAGATRVLESNSLLRHAVFLGEPAGSPTILAQSLVEQLVLRKLPTIVVDGAGIFAHYADPEGWHEAFGTDPDGAGTGVNPRDHLDAIVYTPGAREGRSLNLPLLPPQWNRLSSRERERLANESALAMGDLLGYPPRGGAKLRLSILAAAIQVLGESKPDTALTLEPLIELIASMDPALLTVTGQPDAKHYKTLARDLHTLQLRCDPLFFTGLGDMLDLESLLGQPDGAATDKTRLSLIDTRFLGDRVTLRFWMAHFLMAISRYVAHRSADKLTAAIVFTQVDDYLPNSETSVIKTLLEELCRQAQTAGVALLLETHNPGEMDYTLLEDRIGTCFVGYLEHSSTVEALTSVMDRVKLTGEFNPTSLHNNELYWITQGKIAAVKVKTPLISNRTTDKTAAQERLYTPVPST